MVDPDRPFPRPDSPWAHLGPQEPEPPNPSGWTFPPGCPEPQDDRCCLFGHSQDSCPAAAGAAPPPTTARPEVAVALVRERLAEAMEVLSDEMRANDLARSDLDLERKHMNQRLGLLTTIVGLPDNVLAGLVADVERARRV